METFVILLDKFLSKKPVYWGLFVVAILSLLTTWYYSHSNASLKRQVNIQTDRAAIAEGYLMLQNAKVKEAGREMELLQLKVDAAGNQVQVKSAELEKRKREVTRIVLEGQCEDMLSQVVEEILK